MQPLPDASKYVQPNLPVIIRRERLLERLAAGAEIRGILLIGQAAQGKTTLAADHLAGVEGDAAWLHLGSEDADAAVFFTLLVQALSHAHPQLDLKGFRAHSSIALGAGDAGTRCAARLDALWRRLPESSWIVLDGMEHIAAQARSLPLVQRLLDLSQKGPRLLMTSRQMPPLALQRRIVGRQLTVVENAELAFTVPEVVRYCETLLGFRLNADLAGDIHRITGGWPGGLALLAQTLERVPGDERPRWLASHLPDKLSGESLRYFSEEIFSSQPDRTKGLLVRAAVFDVIDPRVLDGLLEDDGSAAILDDLVARNLFIQRFHDDSGGSRYRINRLFRRFLRSRLRVLCTEAERQDLYRKAGDRLAASEQWESAIQLWFEAGAFDAAAAGIRKIGMDWVIRGRIPDLSRQLEVLPADYCRSDPWLFFLEALTRRLRDGVRSIGRFERALERFADGGEGGGELLALAYLIEAHIFYGLDPAACRRWIQTAERRLAEQSVKPYYAYAKTMLWMQIGFAYVVTGLDVSKGLSASQNAYLLAHRIDDTPLMVMTTLVSALGMALAGAFERAEAALKRITTKVDTGVFAEYQALSDLVAIELALHRGDLEAAGRRLDAIGRDIETFGLLFLYPVYLDATGRCQVYQENLAAAGGTCRHLIDVAVMAGSAFYEGLAHRLAGMVHYRSDRMGEAAAALEQALEILSGGSTSNLHFMRAQQLLAIVLVHQGGLERADRLLGEALDYFAETGNRLSLAETQLAAGILHSRRGDMPRARRHFEQGFEVARSEGFTHFVMLSPADADHAAEIAKKGKVPLSPGQKQEQQKTGTGRTGRGQTPGAGPAPMPAPPKIDPTASAIALPQVLEIRTFGGFEVSRQGSGPIAPGQWGGSRPRLLLKAILVRGIREVPRELLMDDLWPESSTEAAGRNFKVTLHRLRKILEPEMAATRGSSYLRLKDNRISLDRRYCRIDLEDFLQCAKDIKRLDLTGDADAIRLLGRRIMDLYQGDFLPEEPYAPWVEMKRWALKEAYTGALMKVADIHRRQGHLDDAVECCNACIQADPAMEKAGRLLMRLYAEQGRRNQAVQLFERLKTALREEVGVGPDPETLSLFRKISGR